jgi:hypothetical protein
MNFSEQTFDNERIDLQGKSFHGCTFNNCQLVYSGDRSPTFKDNEFVDTVFVFTGPAVRTLYLLGNIYHAGEGGQEVIESTFKGIRDGSIHGHEVHTIAPHTVDHSLA